MCKSKALVYMLSPYVFVLGQCLGVEVSTTTTMRCLRRPFTELLTTIKS